jgi:hypothetical protein
VVLLGFERFQLRLVAAGVAVELRRGAMKRMLSIGVRVVTFEAGKCR